MVECNDIVCVGVEIKMVHHVLCTTNWMLINIMFADLVEPRLQKENGDSSDSCHFLGMLSYTKGASFCAYNPEKVSHYGLVC